MSEKLKSLNASRLPDKPVIGGSKSSANGQESAFVPLQRPSRENTPVSSNVNMWHPSPQQNPYQTPYYSPYYSPGYYPQMYPTPPAGPGMMPMPQWGMYPQYPSMGSQSFLNNTAPGGTSDVTRPSSRGSFVVDRIKKLNVSNDEKASTHTSREASPQPHQQNPTDYSQMYNFNNSMYQPQNMYPSYMDPNAAYSMYSHWHQMYQDYMNNMYYPMARKAKKRSMGDKASAHNSSYNSRLNVLSPSPESTVDDEEEDDVSPVRKPVASQSRVSPEGRTTPLRFPALHSIVKFSHNGALLSTNVTNGPISHISISSTSFQLPLDLLEFPGPFFAKDKRTMKSDIKKYLNSQLKAYSTSRDLPDLDILLKYLMLLLNNNGFADETDVVELLTEKLLASEADHLPEVGNFDETRIENSFCSDASVLNELRNLLLMGKQKECIELAMRENLWGFAIRFSQLISEEMYEYVLSKFDSLNFEHRDSLMTFIRVKSRKPLEFLSSPDQVDWKQHIAVVLANDCDQEQFCSFCLSMGDHLLEANQIIPSQLCYLLARCPFQWPHMPGSKLCLLSKHPSEKLSNFLQDNRAIFLTMILEYCIQMTYADFFIPFLQTCKLSLAVKLLDLGHFQKALAYLENIASIVCNNSTEFQFTFISELYRISESVCAKLQVHPNWFDQLKKIVGAEWNAEYLNKAEPEISKTLPKNVSYNTLEQYGTGGKPGNMEANNVSKPVIFSDKTRTDASTLSFPVITENESSVPRLSEKSKNIPEPLVLNQEPQIPQETPHPQYTMSNGNTSVSTEAISNPLQSGFNVNGTFHGGNESSSVQQGMHANSQPQVPAAPADVDPLISSATNPLTNLSESFRRFSIESHQSSMRPQRRPTIDTDLSDNKSSGAPSPNKPLSTTEGPRTSIDFGDPYAYPNPSSGYDFPGPQDVPSNVGSMEHLAFGQSYSSIPHPPSEPFGQSYTSYDSYNPQSVQRSDSMPSGYESYQKTPVTATIYEQHSGEGAQMEPGPTSGATSQSESQSDEEEGSEDDTTDPYSSRSTANHNPYSLPHETPSLPPPTQPPPFSASIAGTNLGDFQPKSNQPVGGPLASKSTPMIGPMSTNENPYSANKPSTNPFSRSGSKPLSSRQHYPGAFKTTEPVADMLPPPSIPTPQHMYEPTPGSNTPPAAEVDDKAIAPPPADLMQGAMPMFFNPSQYKKPKMFSAPAAPPRS